MLLAINPCSTGRGWPPGQAPPSLLASAAFGPGCGHCPPCGPWWRDCGMCRPPGGLFPLRPETRKCRAGVGENVPQGHPCLGMIPRVMRTVMKAGLPPLNLHWVLLELSFHLDSSLRPPAQDSPSCYKEEAPGGPRQGPAVWQRAPRARHASIQQSTRQPLSPRSVLLDSSHPKRQTEGCDPLPSPARLCDLLLGTDLLVAGVSSVPVADDATEHS